MSKKVAVIMTDLVEDIEYTSPKEAMEAEGHEVVVISPDGSTVEGKKVVNLKRTIPLEMFQLMTMTHY